MTAESADVASTRRPIPWGDGVVSLALLGIGVVVLLAVVRKVAH